MLHVLVWGIAIYHLINLVLDARKYHELVAAIAAEKAAAKKADEDEEDISEEEALGY